MNEFKQVTDGYIKLNISKGTIFQKFVEIVYRYIIRKEDTSSTPRVENNLQAKIKKQIYPEIKYSPDDMLSAEEAAKYINRKISTIYQLTHKKRILYSKPGGGKLYIKRSNLDNYLSRNPMKPNRDNTDEKAKKIIFDK